MSDLLRNDGVDARLSANLHPVTKIYCDERGFICYERDGAAPIVVGASSPMDSRKTAFKRMLATLKAANHEAQRSGHHIIFGLTISNTGRGLTYMQMQRQTDEAIRKSYETEDKITKEIRRKFRTGL